MVVDLNKIKSASFLPGLQNVGTATTTLSVSGIIPNQGNLVGTGSIYFPKECMSAIRVNLPDGHGDLASYWFPVVGTIQLYDAVSLWYLTLYTQPNATGRTISFDFTSNDAVNSVTLSSFRISLFANLFTYPFS